MLKTILKKDSKFLIGSILVAALFSFLIIISVNPVQTLTLVGASQMFIFILAFFGFLLTIPYKSRITVLEANNKIEKDFAKEVMNYIHYVEQIFLTAIFASLIFYGFVAVTLGVKFLLFIFLTFSVSMPIINAIYLVRIINFRNKTESEIYQ